MGNIEAPRTRDSGNHHHPRLERQGLETALPEPGGSWSLEEGSLMGIVVTNGRASRVQVTSRSGKKCPKLTLLPPVPSVAELRQRLGANTGKEQPTGINTLPPNAYHLVTEQS